MFKLLVSIGIISKPSCAAGPGSIRQVASILRTSSITQRLLGFGTDGSTNQIVGCKTRISPQPLGERGIIDRAGCRQGLASVRQVLAGGNHTPELGVSQSKTEQRQHLRLGGCRPIFGFETYRVASPITIDRRRLRYGSRIDGVARSALDFERLEAEQCLN